MLTCIPSLYVGFGFLVFSFNLKIFVESFIIIIIIIIIIILNRLDGA